MKFAIPKKLIIAGTALVAVVAAACSNQVGSAPLNGPQNQTNTIAFVADTGPGPSPILEPDVLYQAELDGARFDRRVWDTDFSRHTVPFEDIFSGGVGWDGIPPIDAPRFWTIEEADPVMDDFEPVVTFKINGEARAYPLAILTWHEVVNDVVGGEPVIVTFCPLCNSALAFKRTLEGRVFDFGVSGNLRNSALIM